MVTENCYLYYVSRDNHIKRLQGTVTTGCIKAYFHAGKDMRYEVDCNPKVVKRYRVWLLEDDHAEAIHLLMDATEKKIKEYELKRDNEQTKYNACKTALYIHNSIQDIKKELHMKQEEK